MCVVGCHQWMDILQQMWECVWVAILQTCGNVCELLSRPGADKSEVAVSASDSGRMGSVQGMALFHFYKIRTNYDIFPPLLGPE